MEFRKLIGFGKSSLVISIPKSWTQKHKLVKGDLVYLNEDEENLILSTREKKYEKNPHAIIINTEGKNISYLEAEILSAYLSNYDIIEIKGNDLKEKSSQLKSILQNLAGIELLDQTSTKIIAKDLMDLRELSIETLIRRIDITIRSMFQDLLTGDSKYIESISQRDRDVNRLVFLIKRVIKLAFKDHEISRHLARTNKDLLRDWNMVSLLESIGDEVKRISRFAGDTDMKNKNVKALFNINGILNKLYLDLMKAYHVNDKKFAYEIEVTHKKRIKDIDTIVKNIKTYENSLLAYHIKGLESHLKNMARYLLSD